MTEPSATWEAPRTATAQAANAVEGAEATIATYVLRPNCSMSWATALAVYAVCFLITMGIGVHFLRAGLPLVLPFSGLEMLVLGVAWYLVLRNGERREVLRVERDRVIVQFGRRTKLSEVALQRSWVCAVLDRPRHAARETNRLKLRASGCEVEIGSFLTDAERRNLGRELSRHMPFRCVGGADAAPRATEANPLTRDS